MACASSIAFWQMSAFSSSVGRILMAASVTMIGRAIGRHGDQEAVAEPPFGTQAPLLLHHLVQQLVGMQAALHQRFGLAGADHRHRHLGGVMAVLGRHQPIRRDVDSFARGDGADLFLRADQDGRDQIALGRFDRPLQRVVAARVDDGRGQRRQAIARLDQLQIAVLAPQLDRRQVSRQGMADLLPGRHHLEGADEQFLATVVGARAVEHDRGAFRPLFLDGDGRRHAGRSAPAG